MDRFYATIPMRQREEAGWFQETNRIRDQHWIRALGFAHASLTKDEPVVLLSTGALAPTHEGHIMALELAKKHLTELGFDVIAGFLSPGHDEYLRVKGINFPAALRIAIANNWAANTDWIKVDTYEAYGCGCAVNFTEIHEHLEDALQKINPKIQVCFVCGSDNARFALAYQCYGMCCVIEREATNSKYSKDYSKSTYLRRGIQEGRIHFVKNDTEFAKYSSSQIRAGVLCTAQATQEAIQNFRNPQRKLNLRLTREIDRNTLRLKNILSEYFEVTTESSSVQALNLGVMRNTISLDVEIAGKAYMAISRLWEIGGYGRNRWVERPGSCSIRKQVSRILPGEYTLFDDDSYTGGTFRFAQNIIEKYSHGKIKITGTKTAWSQSDSEVADDKDYFLTGTGGLVITLPNNNIGRAPYCLPFVDPCARTSIPYDKAIQFSYEIWKLNYDLFAGSNLDLRDLHDANSAVFLAAGWKAKDLLQNICLYYMDFYKKHLELNESC